MRLGCNPTRTSQRSSKRNLGCRGFGFRGLGFRVVGLEGSWGGGGVLVSPKPCNPKTRNPRSTTLSNGKGSTVNKLQGVFPVSPPYLELRGT